MRRAGGVWDLLTPSPSVQEEYRRQMRESGFRGSVSDFQVVVLRDLGAQAAEADRIRTLISPLVNSRDEPTWNNYLGVRDLIVRAGTRLVELGCRSPSYFLRDAARHGVDCLGVDLCFHTDGHGDAGYTKVLADMRHLPLSDGVVDTVFVSSALHHTPDLRTTVREVHRVLRPGGRFILASEPPVRLWQRAGLVPRAPQDKARYTCPEYLRALRQGGFARVELRFPHHISEVLTRGAPANRHRSLARALAAAWRLPLGRRAVTGLGLSPGLLLLGLPLVAVATK